MLGLLENWAHVKLADGSTGWLLISALDGDVSSAVPNEFSLNTACALNDAEGRVLTMLGQGTRVVLDEPRTCVTLKTVNGTHVLQKPLRLRVHTADYVWWGYVPADAVDTGL